MTVEEAELMRERRRAAKRRQRKLYRIRHRAAWKAEKKRWKKRRRERGSLLSADGDEDAIAWCERFRAKRRRWSRNYYRKHRDEVLAAQKIWRANHPDIMRQRNQDQGEKRKKRYHSCSAYRLICLHRCKRYRLRRTLRHMVDMDAYAIFRARCRMQGAMKCVRTGRLYTPRFHRRIPDWCVRGGALDASSAWLEANLTPSQRAYVKELARERWK